MGFAKAIKRDAKARVAFIGPAGSGKSYTMLVMARLLAGPAGKIAAIDTEHGTLSKYADLFEFDVDEPKSFNVEYWLAKLTEAEQGGYAVFCTDSLSHFWMGAGGALEFVDERAKSGGRGDSFSGWKAFRPHERAMVDRMIASPCHIICTMRTQNEYVEETNERGKKVRRKIGLKPVQRDGLEYEFDLVGAMDEENTLVIDKSRVMLADGRSPYSGKVFSRPKAAEFQAFVDWLKGEKAEPKPPTTNGTPPIDKVAWLRAELPLVSKEETLLKYRAAIGRCGASDEVQRELGVLWFRRRLQLTTMADTLLAVLEEAGRQGFTPEQTESLESAYDAQLASITGAVEMGAPVGAMAPGGDDIAF